MISYPFPPSVSPAEAPQPLDRPLGRSVTLIWDSACPQIQVNYTLLADICNLWRNFDDIQDSWRSVLSVLDWFVIHQDVLQPIAGPGHWNDPDMVPAWRGLARGPRPCAVFLGALCQAPAQHL